MNKSGDSNRKSKTKDHKEVKPPRNPIVAEEEVIETLCQWRDLQVEIPQTPELSQVSQIHISLGFCYRQSREKWVIFLPLIYPNQIHLSYFTNSWINKSEAERLWVSIAWKSLSLAQLHICGMEVWTEIKITSLHQVIVNLQHELASSSHLLIEVSIDRKDAWKDFLTSNPFAQKSVSQSDSWDSLKLKKKVNISKETRVKREPQDWERI